MAHICGCAAGELVKVVAVGGSVSTGMGAHHLEQSYLHRVIAWLHSLGDARHPVRIEVRLPSHALSGLLACPFWPARMLTRHDTPADATARTMLQGGTHET